MTSGGAASLVLDVDPWDPEKPQSRSYRRTVTLCLEPYAMCSWLVIDVSAQKVCVYPNCNTYEILGPEGAKHVRPFTACRGT